jgi:hypothetical protein
MNFFDEASDRLYAHLLAAKPSPQELDAWLHDQKNWTAE